MLLCMIVFSLHGSDGDDWPSTKPPPPPAHEIWYKKGDSVRIRDFDDQKYYQENKDEAAPSQSMSERARVAGIRVERLNDALQRQIVQQGQQLRKEISDRQCNSASGRRIVEESKRNSVLQQALRDRDSEIMELRSERERLKRIFNH